jgi:hypothetical protein
MLDLYFYASNDSDKKALQEDYTRWTGYHSNFTPWVAQTYFYLKQAGFSCKIADKFPDRGIVLTDRDTLADNYPFLDRVMLVCIKSDKEYHPSAHLHLVHNINSWQRDRNTFWNPHFISHWPMPGIVPRIKERQNLVENIAYIGHHSQIATELKSASWEKALVDRDYHWMPILDKGKWNDYTNVDAIVAARSFDSKTYANKGAIKLINAWHAGVPAILTPESGFLAERKTDLDFLIIRSQEEAIQAIDRLKNSPKLYDRMVCNGYERAKEYSIQQTLSRWIGIVENNIFPAYEQWSNMNLYEKKMLFYKRMMAFRFDRLRRKFC